MKKSLIKLGQKVFWDGKKDNVQVTVIDVDLQGDKVGIMDGGISHIVDAKNLSLTPSTYEKVTPVESVVKVEPVCTKPTIIASYDEKTSSLFLVINDKATICIPGVKEQTLGMVGVSYKHDDDTFNKEIGRALAFYRSEEGKQKFFEQNKSPLAQLMGF